MAWTERTIPPWSATEPAACPEAAPRGERYPAEGPAEPTPVALFAGCVMSTALADVDRATIRVLQRAGCEVSNTAGQACCGALHAHGGDLAGARRLFKRNIEAFEREGEAPIVVNSAGCGAMLKDYGHHLRDEAEWAERARRLSARVVDATQLLAGRELPMRRSLPIAATYQDPCHLAHAQRISQQPHGQSQPPGVGEQAEADPAGDPLGRRARQARLDRGAQGDLHRVHVDAGRADRRAGVADQAVLLVLDQVGREGHLPLDQGAHQRDPPARALGLVHREQVGRARGQALAAADAAQHVQPLAAQQL